MRSYEWEFLIGVPAAWVVLFLLYAVRCLRYGRYPVPGLRRRSTSAWLPRMTQEFGYWLYQTPVRGLVRLGVTADMLTVSSVGLAGVAAVLIGQGHFGLGGWVLLIGFTLDVWDGMVARLQGQASPAGEFLDATLDRYSDLIGMGGFLYYYRAQSGPLLLVLAALGGSTLVSYTRAKGECLGVVAEVGYMRRYERAVWLGVGTVLAPVAAAFWEPGRARPQYYLLLAVMAVLAVLAHVTAVWRICYVLRALRLARKDSLSVHGHSGDAR